MTTAELPGPRPQAASDLVVILPVPPADERAGPSTPRPMRFRRRALMIASAVRKNQDYFAAIPRRPLVRGSRLLPLNVVKNYVEGFLELAARSRFRRLICKKMPAFAVRNNSTVAPPVRPPGADTGRSASCRSNSDRSDSRPTATTVVSEHQPAPGDGQRRPERPEHRYRQERGRRRAEQPSLRRRTGLGSGTGDA